MGRLATRPTQVKRIPKPLRVNPCDRCGVSRIDGVSIAAAKFEIHVPGGSLFLCGHHTAMHFAHFLERGYEVTKIDA